MDTNIPPSNSLYNIPQNDYRNNTTFTPAQNQYQNQNYTYPAEDITYLPQNQPMINNQYPPQNQQIIQQAPPPQYNNLPLKKLSIDTSNMAKSAALNSAPPQINTSGMNSGSPYYIASPRRRRGDHTNYESTIRAFFGRTKQQHVIYDINHTKPFTVIIDPKVDRGFFVAENIWTCYRRNYFQISTVFNCFDINTNEQIQLPCLVEVDKKLLKINSFSLGISARVSGSDKKIDIIQHTPKRDKGPQNIPKPKLIKVGGSHSQFASIGNEQSMVTFERLQFKTATANNGKRRAAQQYYVLCLDLIGNTEEGEVKIATIESDNLVVRGRSPGHYNDISLNTAIPATVNMSSSASAADGRYRYPLTPTYQYNNSPMILSPHSPASPGIPFHTGNQTPIQAPHSMLRQPPLNYNSPQQMTTLSSNPGTPTNAGTPINMAVTTAAGMAMNNGYAVKDESTPYYTNGQPNPNSNINSNQNMNMTPSQTPSQNPNGQNPNEYYDNSQSASSLYNTNQPPQQNYIQQTTTLPQPSQNQPQAGYYAANDYTNSPQPQPQPHYENASFYPVTQPQQPQPQPQQGQPHVEQYNTTNPQAQTIPNGATTYRTVTGPQTTATYQGTPTQPTQNIYMNQPPPQQTNTPLAPPQGGLQGAPQGQYVNTTFQTQIPQQNQYTMQPMTQTPTQNTSQPQEYTQNPNGPQPHPTYIAQTQTTTQAAYLTPPQATTQQTPPIQNNNYINGISAQAPAQAQAPNSYMDSPQPKLPTLDKSNTIMGKETVEYLNSPSSNKNDIIDSNKPTAESHQYIEANNSLPKETKTWLTTSTINPPSIASTQHNEISSLTSK